MISGDIRCELCVGEKRNECNERFKIFRRAIDHTSEMAAGDEVLNLELNELRGCNEGFGVPGELIDPEASKTIDMVDFHIDLRGRFLDDLVNSQNRIGCTLTAQEIELKLNTFNTGE